MLAMALVLPNGLQIPAPATETETVSRIWHGRDEHRWMWTVTSITIILKASLIKTYNVFNPIYRGLRSVFLPRSEIPKFRVIFLALESIIRCF